ncbi:lipopolysaccharide biosynthesis protein [Shouchella clausii]|uniref:lipopolysaccharide biosynthesis protein n=1 Tax=Shouchella clausii TaxID=79880 RepID=UPI000BA7327A|nr:oligosaccharide flippase family protein [Shouchella clausii]MBX0319607.1 oligosaccharide flippase family protein [Shouchella clausii]MCZ1182572.1 hypothetical protein [Shouchella clausii]MDO7283912.1 oligosaccharide flippase family protein [Shouchella clausii]MDO7304008.1 oligosaccharide flippase family protein [Shouchella clausii]PAF09769.1 hypothetical protein CHH65_08940 [Shouchella clausii]
MIRVITGNKFIKNVGILMSGTAIAQAVTVLIAPLLTRLYSPESYGVFGLYTSIISVISVLMTLKYEMSIVLPKSDKHAVNLLVLCQLLVASITVIVSILIYVFYDKISFYLNSPGLKGVLWLIPLSVFSMGAYNMLNFWTTRNKKFSSLSRSRILQSTSASGAQVLLGFGQFGAIGLVIGQCVGQILSVVNLLFGTLKRYRFFIKDNMNIMQIKELAIKYKHFPLFSAPQSFVNVVSQMSAPLILGFYFGPATVGLYTMALKLIELPANLVGEAFRQVHFQYFSELKNKNGDVAGNLIKATSILALIAIVPVTIIFIFAPNIFSFLLGDEWYEAGKYSSWLAIWIYFWFVNRPTVTAIQVYGWQKYLLYFELGLLLARIVILYVASIYFNAYIGVILFSLIGAALTPITTLCTLFAVTKNKNKG